MHFKKHERSQHYYDSEDKDFVFVNTVSGSKESYSKQQIKDEENSRGMYVSLGYPPVKYFKWVIQSNQIKYCTVMLQDIDVDHKIWGKIV